MENPAISSREPTRNIVPFAADGDGIPDADLITRVARLDDDAAFEALVKRYYAPAFALARSRLGDEHLAQDAVQETFVRIFRERARYDPGQSFAAWFYTILRNIVTDATRKEGRHRGKLQMLAAVDRDPPVVCSSAHDCAALLACLDEHDREILIYHHIHGMSLAEVARMLRIGTEAAKKRAQRALKKLKAIVSPQNEPRRTASGHGG